ncbi:hypothetical protein ACFSJ3_07505 [Corallincola platygyrae]|uniref:DUF4198 domain-containing protein n=1 Tax=Corallincola platygyrae TaxID=1193278 RepID=A0ABW4XJW8_9GAMM
MKRFLLGFIVLLTFNASAHTHDHSYGVHGMALFQVENDWYAYHMPLHGGKHAHQVLMRVTLTSDNQAALPQSYSADLLSIAPEPFSLMKLMHGELNEFNATLFKGHFERGGKAIDNSLRVKVEARLLLTDLNATRNGDYYLVPLSQERQLLVHCIAPVPSFDQIIVVNDVAEKLPTLVVEGRTMVRLKNSEPLLDGQPLRKEAPQLDWRLIYLETVDFSSRKHVH